MIQKALVDIMFRASYMKRWTDRVRPVDFTVLGKEAHAMSATWLLGRRYEVETGNALNWALMVEAGIFSMLEKCVLSDIKAQVFDSLMSDQAAGESLRQHVMQSLKDPLGDVNRGLYDRFESHLQNGRHDQDGIEYEILRASSWLASNWEWELIKGWGDGTVHSMENPQDSLDADFPAVEAMAKYLRKGHQDHDDGLTKLWDLSGRLRFQDRWTQTPLVPRRAVLDHELLVGVLAYLAFLDALPRDWDKPTSGDNRLPPKAERAARDFYAGLFHDMAEATTRDIISPVKNISPAVNARIEALELEYFQSKIGPLIPDQEWRNEFAAFVLHPFDEAATDYNGRSIKGCDVFAAFMEAYYSVKCGTYSPWLKNAIQVMFEHRRQFSPRAGEAGAGVNFNGVDLEVVYELCFHDVEPQLRSIGS
jgi:putative hydrolase of HD superfamily